MFHLLNLEPVERQCIDYWVSVKEDEGKDGSQWKASSGGAGEQAESTEGITQVFAMFFRSFILCPRCMFCHSPAIMEVNAWCCTLSAKCLMLGAVRSVCLGLMVLLGGNGLESWNAQKGEFLLLSYCIHLQYSFLSPQFPLLLILWANSWRTAVTAHWQPGCLWGHLYLRRSRIFITVQFYPFCSIFAA